MADSDSWFDELYDQYVPKPNGKTNGHTPPRRPLIVTSKQFCDDFEPPDFVIEQMLIRSFLYALTGKTGSGKTSVLLRLAAAVALGQQFAGRQVEQGRVLYLAAENDLDTRMRWIALAQQMGFDPEEIEVFFIPGTFALSDNVGNIAQDISQHGDIALVIVDTAPVFFEGEDQNSRQQQLLHGRLLRSLIERLPGKPAVVAACHPHKHADNDSLVPAGGGTFLNEIDGNFSMAQDDGAITLHWQGKFRGVEFAPIHFRVRTVTHERLKTKRGVLIPTVVADWISESEQERIQEAATDNRMRVLQIVADQPGVSMAALALAMEWKLYNGEPNKMKASRTVAQLLKAKLLDKDDRDRLVTTTKGRSALAEERNVTPSPSRGAESVTPSENPFD